MSFSKYSKTAKYIFENAWTNCIVNSNLQNALAFEL